MAFKMELKSIYYVVNVDWFFLSHRLPLALDAQKRGYDVTIVTNDTGNSDIIRNYGFSFIHLPIDRGYSNLLNELKVFFFLFKLYLFNKPTIIHQVGLKVIIFGSIAHALSFSKSCLVNALSGAGTMFTGTHTKKTFTVLLKIFKLFSKKKTHYIFQNSEDLLLFKKLLMTNLQNVAIIKGSGVDVNLFNYKKVETKGIKTILFVGRMLKEKGVIELFEAAKILREKYFGKIRFIFVGAIDNYNPSGISQELINSYLVCNYIEWEGYKKEVREYMEKSYLVILPSYREGLPKSLIEACAVGRAIITTNAVGCKDVVEDGVNGLLVPVKSSKEIASKIKFLVKNEKLVDYMGIESRKKAVNEFSLEKIILDTNEVYEDAVFSNKKCR